MKKWRGVNLALDRAAGERAARARRLRHTWVGLLALVVMPLAAGAMAFRQVGTWLVVRDPLNHADVVVVLSGELPARALEAARVYRAGYAPLVWVSQGVSPSEELRKMNIAFLGEDFYNEKVLLAQGVPLDAITILDEPVANTEQEVREITAAMTDDKFQSAILVTSPAHTRRVRTIWRKLAPANLHVMVCPDDEPYDGAHWWRHTQDALDVSRELPGLVNAWSGFHVRPGQN